jgi:UDP-N-acetylmuramate dehydrogenase
MKIIEGKSLAPFTTFRIGGDARFFCAVENKEDLQKAINFAKEKSLPIFIFGGGSNILVSDKGFDGLVVKIDIKGIEKLENDSVRAGAGENWDDFVGWAVSNGYGGLENLSLIPGTVGAAPVQNIGAYGVEVGNLIESVEVFDVKENAFKNLEHKECHFSYRDSLFKKEKGRYIIVSVLFTLKKKNTKPDISYKDLKEYFKDTSESSIVEVRAAVIAIRTAKLPDVRKVGTAGSFFKNPIISNEKYLGLKETYPELPNFPESDGRVKIPLAWIIDKICGLKGKRFGKAGIHETQALVIVNHGAASFEDVEKVAREVEKEVKEKTGTDIEREVIMV